MLGDCIELWLAGVFYVLVLPYPPDNFQHLHEMQMHMYLIDIKQRYSLCWNFTMHYNDLTVTKTVFLSLVLYA